MHRQIEIALRDAILSGRLKAGERLLASRELQRHFGVSRNTVVAALAQLQGEGYLVTIHGSGTFVAEVIDAPANTLLDQEEEEFAPIATQALFNGASFAANEGPALPFRPGIPALDLFPSALFKRSLSSALTNSVLDYPDAFGNISLREQISTRLQQTRGIACSHEQIAIVTGAQAAFDLIARVLVASGDHVIVEDPGYPNIRGIFAAQHVQVVPVPVDEFGLRVELLSRNAAQLVYVTPSHQYPTGAVLPLDRRLALLNWAAQHRAWIIEDDYDSEFNYTGRFQPALHSLDDGRRTLYVGTFSKVLAPGLRTAYIVLPKPLVKVFEAALTVNSASPPSVLQQALAVFIERGFLGRHVANMRKVYDERRRLLTDELSRRLHWSVVDSKTGLHFIARLPRDVDDASISAQAEREGIIVPALSKYFYGAASNSGLVFGYAATPFPAAKSAVTRLASMLSI